MCSISEMGSYLRRIDCVYHSTLGLRVIEKMKRRYCRIIEWFEEAEGPVNLVIFSLCRPLCGALETPALVPTLVGRTLSPEGSELGTLPLSTDNKPPTDLDKVDGTRQS